MSTTIETDLLRRALALLEQVEWAGQKPMIDDEPYCLTCGAGGASDDPHKPGCEILAVIEAVRSALE